MKSSKCYPRYIQVYVYTFVQEFMANKLISKHCKNERKLQCFIVWLVQYWPCRL